MGVMVHLKDELASTRLQEKGPARSKVQRQEITWFEQEIISNSMLLKHVFVQGCCNE